jgi:hypothetical protein
MKEWSGTTLDASGGRRAFALTKLAARRRGVNPVWYVDMTSGHDWVISPALNQLRDWTANWAATEGKPFASYPTATDGYAVAIVLGSEFNADLDAQDAEEAAGFPDGWLERLPAVRNFARVRLVAC